MQMLIKENGMILGFDIGGTKCAVIKARADGENIELLDKRKIPTRLDIPPEEMIESLISLADEMLGGERAEKIGISCGGPLNSVTGTIEGPPNLPGWDNVRITDILEKHYKAPAKLMNDADAAYKGDETAKKVYRICGDQLGKGISVLIDILNPERIVIGSIFARSEGLLREGMEGLINKEALPQSLKCCKTVPAALGEKIGDYAAVSAALL